MASRSVVSWCPKRHCREFQLFLVHAPCQRVLLPLSAANLDVSCQVDHPRPVDGKIPYHEGRTDFFSILKPHVAQGPLHLKADERCTGIRKVPSNLPRKDNCSAFCFVLLLAPLNLASSEEKLQIEITAPLLCLRQVPRTMNASLLIFWFMRSISSACVHIGVKKRGVCSGHGSECEMGLRKS